jgi:hypothetical protein
MADKKTGSARRMRDEDDSPKKKQSGVQKNIKKSASSKRPASRDEDDADDGDEEEAPRPAKKGSARSAKGDSARQREGGPPQRGPDKGKIFLYFVPGMILILLGAGYYVATLPEPKKAEDVKINFDDKIEEARKMFNTAKSLIVESAKPEYEGEKGVPKLAESYRLMCEAHNTIQKVRNDLADLEKKAATDKNIKMGDGNKADDKKATSTGYAFDPLDAEIQSQKVGLRKMINERPGGLEAIKAYVAKDQEEAKNNKDEEDLLK